MSNQELSATGTIFGTLLIIFVPIFLLFKVIFTDHTPEVATAAPIIEVDVRHHGYLEDSDTDREYGRFSTMPIMVQMSDNILYTTSTSEQASRDYIIIRAKEDSKNPSKEKLTLTITGDIERTDEGRITLNNQDFSLGETQFTVTATNSKGSTSKAFTVAKTSVAHECAGYAEKYHDDFAPLVDSVETYCNAWKTYRDRQNAPTPSTSPEPSTGPRPSHSSCLHYEAGRCWDDLEDEAYSQGQYDKHYGHYGASYYESDDCDDICKDILEDAYNEGFDDY